MAAACLQPSGLPMYNPLSLPEPHADPFRRMLAHPAVMSRLDWMLGRHFRLWGPPTARETPVGGIGQLLHGGLGWSQRGIPADFHSYHFANGQCHAEAVNVAWQLCDQRESDGGFVILPGSSKGQYPVPESMHHLQVILPVWSTSRPSWRRRYSLRMHRTTLSH